MTDNTLLAGKVVLVTGAGGGIGPGVARFGGWDTASSIESSDLEDDVDFDSRTAGAGADATHASRLSPSFLRAVHDAIASELAEEGVPIALFYALFTCLLALLVTIAVNALFGRFLFGKTAGETAAASAATSKPGSGDAVLLAGACGAGKTSLLRAVAGLWDQGGGEVRWRGVDASDLTPESRDQAGGAAADAPNVAENSGMYFLPQRPYLVLGTLRQQLLYPTWIQPQKAEYSTFKPFWANKDGEDDDEE